MLQAGRSSVRVPDEVDIFNLPNPSSRTIALVSTHPLTKMSTRNLSRCNKSGRRVGLTTWPPSMSRISKNVGASTSRNPKGIHGYRDNFALRASSHLSQALFIIIVTTSWIKLHLRRGKPLKKFPVY
jgi:hypothetical protein